MKSRLPTLRLVDAFKDHTFNIEIKYSNIQTSNYSKISYLCRIPRPLDPLISPGEAQRVGDGGCGGGHLGVCRDSNHRNQDINFLRLFEGETFKLRNHFWRHPQVAELFRVPFFLYARKLASAHVVPACRVLVWCAVPSVGAAPRSPPSADDPRGIGHLIDKGGTQTHRSFDANTYRLWMYDLQMC